MRSIGRSVRSVRSVCVKKRKIRVNKNYSGYSDYYFPSVSGPTANLVFKKLKYVVYWLNTNNLN